MALLAENKAILSEQIVQKIIDEIKCGNLRPGEKLPTEKQLVDLFQVSRITVREALRTLKVMNIIDIKQGKGAFITSTDVNLLIDQLDFVFLLEKTTISQLFEARRALEPQIAAIAAARITDEEVAEMRVMSQQDGYDILLHQKIAECTKNPVLVRFVSSIWSMGEISRQMTSKIPGVKTVAYSQHAALIEALAAHDGNQARALMSKHLEFVENTYRMNNPGTEN